MGGRTFERKAPFETTSFKKGVSVFSRVGLFSGDYSITPRSKHRPVHNDSYIVQNFALQLSCIMHVHQCMPSVLVWQRNYY